MKEVPTMPMFPEPVKPPLELSRMWAGPMFRATVGTVRWAQIKNKNPVDCIECVARQHETAGAWGPRRAAKVRRSIVKAPGTTLSLCREHETLWRERDEVDQRTT